MSSWPASWSKWSLPDHPKVTVLTIAKGRGTLDGTELVYYIEPNDLSGSWRAAVMPLDEWNKVAESLEEEYDELI